MNDIIHAPHVTLTQLVGELLIRVRSNHLLDLPRVKETLSSAQLALCEGYSERPSDYQPHLVTESERAQHGFKYDESWLFAAKDPALEVVFAGAGTPATEGWAITARHLTWPIVQEQLPSDIRQAAEFVEWCAIDDAFECWVFKVAS